MWTAANTFIAAHVTPVGQATGDLVSYILGYGVLGIVSLALAFQFLVPAAAVKAAREQARGDLMEENKRLREEKAHAEEQRDEALKIAQDQLVPLLVNFNATVTGLMPLLQSIVQRTEGRRDDRERR